MKFSYEKYKRITNEKSMELTVLQNIIQKPNPSTTIYPKSQKKTKQRVVILWKILVKELFKRIIL